MPARKRVGLALIVGQNVKRLREKAGMSQIRLAEDAGVHQVTISNVETGARGPSMMLVMNIAKALGVPSTSLFKDHTKGGAK